MELYSLFTTYLTTGFNHLTDLGAYDHILFIVALSIIYRAQDWKKLLLLVTAFTIGHSITLALAVMDVITFPQDLIEWLIPVTILITAISNFISYQNKENNAGDFKANMKRNYAFALGFGLIHGMGFSSFLKSTIMPGEEQNLIWQLLAFNLGLELGQLLVVLIVFLLSFIALNILSINQKRWVQVVSLTVIGFTFWVMWGLFNG